VKLLNRYKRSHNTRGAVLEPRLSRSRYNSRNNGRNKYVNRSAVDSQVRHKSAAHRTSCRCHDGYYSNHGCHDVVHQQPATSPKHGFNIRRSSTNAFMSPSSNSLCWFYVITDVSSSSRFLATFQQYLAARQCRVNTFRTERLNSVCVAGSHNVHHGSQRPLSTPGHPYRSSTRVFQCVMLDRARRAVAILVIPRAPALAAADTACSSGIPSSIVPSELVMSPSPRHLSTHDSQDFISAT